MENVKWGGVIGGALMAIGSFLPWASAGFFSVAGTDGDGIFTLIGGVLVVAVVLSKRVGTVPGLLVVLVGLFCGWITYNVYSNFGGFGNLGDGPSAGTGLFVSGLGSVIAFFAGIGIMKAPTAAPVTPPQTDSSS